MRQQLIKYSGIALAVLVLLSVAVGAAGEVLAAAGMGGFAILAVLVLAGLILLVWTVSFVAQKKVTVTVSPILAGLAVMALAAILSMFFGGRSTGAVSKAVWGRAGLWTAWLFIFAAGSSLPKTVSLSKWLKRVLIAVAVLAAAAAMAGTAAEISANTGRAPILQKAAFLRGFKIQNLWAKDKLSASIGWQIAIETMKEKPIWGVGPGGYLSAYTAYRPISTNQMDIWNRRFLAAPNELLQTFTTTGLAGLLALAFLAWQVFRLAKVSPKTARGTKIALTLVGLSLAAAALSAGLIAALAGLLIILALENKNKTDSVYETTLGLVSVKEGGVPKLVAILPWVLLGPAIIILGADLWFNSRALRAELAYRRAILAVIQNDGTEAYNQLIAAISQNPAIDLYHRQYADINLRLANNLAAQENLSDQDRADVSQLIQQSIREAKLAVMLDPADVQNWEVLSRVYRALVNVAQGAGDWTLVTYQETIRRDPANPVLRLELGGLFYTFKDWENAVRNFQIAVSLKPDFANGWFNLALAYEQDNRLVPAVRAMQATLQNLKVGTADYDTAQNKLEELTKKAGEMQAPAAGGESQLSEPALPTPLPGANRVKLGEEEAPPVTPSPTPEEPSPTPPEE